MLSNFGFKRQSAERGSNRRGSASSSSCPDESDQQVKNTNPAMGRSSKNNNASTGASNSSSMARRSQQQLAEPDQSRIWRSAIDAKTGRTYYYDVLTRETQWRKPIELATDEERLAMQKKENKQKEFFASMELNVLRNLAQGSYSPLTKAEDEERDGLGQLKVIEAAVNKVSFVHKDQIGVGKVNKPSRAVRTISSMDQHVLEELTRVEKENANLDAVVSMSKKSKQAVSPTSVITTNSTFDFGDSIALNMGFDNCHGEHSFSATDSTVSSEEEKERAIAEVERVAHVMALLDLSPSSTESIESRNESVARPSHKLNKPMLRKRNTCSTIYVGSTMSAPDKDATIKCICGVFRAHLLQSVSEINSLSIKTRFEEYEIFDDIPYSGANKKLPNPDIPSLDEITFFFRDVFNKAQMEADCIIMSLIYVERLIKETNGGVRPHPTNWRSILFSSMILASKVWDDLSMWNADFSHCVGSRDSGVRFTLQRINELERAMLGCLKYNVKVLASEYAKYYFLLRSMLIRSGLAGKDLTSLLPLDIEGAKQMQLKSACAARAHSSAAAHNNPVFCSDVEKPRNRRSKSLGNRSGRVMYGSSHGEFLKSDAVGERSPASVRAHLEQIVHM